MADKMEFRNVAHFLVFLVVFMLNLISSQGALSRSRVVSCNIGSIEQNIPSQIFNPVSMRCENCELSSGTWRDSTGLSCECLPGYRYTKNFGGVEVNCIKCDSNEEVTSADGWSCVRCSQGINPDTKSCNLCPDADESVSADRDLSGTSFVNGNGLLESRCILCQSSTSPSADGSRCERCNHVLQTSPPVPGLSTLSDCSCTQQETGGFCLGSNVLPLDNLVSYELLLTNNEETAVSRYMTDNLKAAYALCKTYNNWTSCEQLANLCTSDYSSLNSQICKLYRRDIKSQISNAIITVLPIEDWPDKLPWLYYSEDGESLLRQTEIDTEFTFTQDQVTSLIKFRVAMFTINGTYLGITSIENGRLQLCPDTQKRLNAAWLFGTHYSQYCDLNVFELLDRNLHETIFYDLYLEYTSSRGQELFPVPALIKNFYSEDGKQVNAEDNTADWQFVRRFFLIDNVMFSDIDGNANILRYVKSMEIKLELIANGGGKIYSPYVVLDYDHIKKSDANENSTVNTSFSVTYEMNSAKFNTDLSIALGVLGCLAGVYAAVMTWTWARRSGNASFCLVMIKFLLFACGTLSNCFLIILSFTALWWIVFFKRQDVVYVLPVTEDQEILFRNFLIIAMVLKFIEMIHMFVVQDSIDIFLIDWERPKSSYKGNDQEKPVDSPVSIWRTYFVANEWNEIQTARKICPLFQIFVTVFFLQVVGFENITTKDSVTAFSIDPAEYKSTDSLMFRFGVMSIIWLCVAIIQWIFFTFIWERFVDDNVRQFVDLCSMANVSVFIMEYSQFGYYIHGRSPHGIADTGMREMFQQLKREQESLCGHRGLVPNTDAQTFRMCLPLKLRQKYDEVLRPLNDRRRHTAQRAMAVAYDQFTMYNPDLPHSQPTYWAQQLEDKLQATRGQGQGENDKFYQAVAAYSKINKFLADFLDHSLRELDYAVKDKMFFESVLDAEFEQVIEKGQFYNDNGHSFDQVLFYGHELTLTSFEILLFGFVDSIAGGNYILAAVIVYFVELFLRLIREAWGRKNLANKTLVDDRFLI